MASVQNRVYPLSEFGEIRTSRIRATDSILSGTTWSGSTILTLTGSSHIQGFLAQGIIYRYQPVVFSTNTASVLTYVSGASSWGQGGILGVAAGHVADGGAVTIITEGIVPMCTSGASVPTTGSYVIFAASGSWFTGSAALGLTPAIAPAINAPGLGTGSGIIGVCAVVHVAVNQAFPVQVWVQPHALVAS